MLAIPAAGRTNDRPSHSSPVLSLLPGLSATSPRLFYLRTLCPVYGQEIVLSDRKAGMRVPRGAEVVFGAEQKRASKESIMKDHAELLLQNRLTQST